MAKGTARKIALPPLSLAAQVTREREGSEADDALEPGLSRPSTPCTSSRHTPSPVKVTGGKLPPLWLRRQQAKEVRGSPLSLNLTPDSSRSTGVSSTASADSKLEEDFSVMEVLGQGSTGLVRRAVCRADGRHVALKIVRSDEEEVLATAQHEYELLRRLEHPNIVKAYDYLTPHPTQAILVLEYCDGRNLEVTVRKAPEGVLPESASCWLFYCLAKALQFLHQRGIAHRDIKPKNLMISRDLKQLRLVDFNVAGQKIDGLMTPTGTRMYAAPEVVRGDSPSEASDIWAAGLCLHLMLSGLLPLPTPTWSCSKCETGVGSKVDATRSGSKSEAAGAPIDCTPPTTGAVAPASATTPPIAGRISPQLVRQSCLAAAPEAAVELLQRCLTVYEAERPTAEELVKANWLQQVADASSTSC